MYLHLKRTPMIFFNFAFLFLFSLVPISLLSSEPLVRPVKSTQDSRDVSPTLEVRAPTAKTDEYESFMYYEYPGSKDVSMVSLKKQNDRRSVPILNTQISPSIPRSLPEESKLEKMVASAPVNQALSQSTERFDLLRNEIAVLKELVIRLVNQQSKGNPENPTK